MNRRKQQVCAKNPDVDAKLLPFEVGYLPDLYVRKAEVELNETPDNRESSLESLRELISNDKTLEEWSDIEDDILLLYLRVRKFNVQRALSSFQSYVNLRKKEPYIWDDIDYGRLSRFVAQQCIAFLPYRCPDGCAILWFQLDNWDPTEFPSEDLKRVAAVFFQNASRDPMTQVNGYKVIFEMTSNPLKYIRHLTPQNLYLLYHGTTECIPGRYKAIHVVNNTWLMKLIYMISMKFVSKKIQSRTFFHSNCNELLDFFPKSCLPVKYSGDIEDCCQLEWFKKATTCMNQWKMYGSCKLRT